MNRNVTNGFSLIELTLYVALIGLIITGLVNFAWDVVYGREKTFQQQVVDQNAKIALSKIGNYIETSKDIASITSNSIVLEKEEGTLEISLNGEVVEVTEDTNTYSLTSNQVRVTSFVTRNLSTVNENSNNIEIELTIEQGAQTIDPDLTAITTIKGSFELNAAFNESRRLLYDTSGLTLSGDTDLTGIVIENTGDSDITIDQMQLSWSNTAGGERITEVQIGGGNTEWNGSSNSGDTLNLTNFVLSSGSPVDIDYLTFNSDISGAVIDIGIIMIDGSQSELQVYLESDEPSPTPTEGPSPAPTSTPTTTPNNTPTPTPTPSDETCSTYCINQGYDGGFCRANARQCEQNNESYEPNGNQYCTGGGGEDTCCCF